MRNMENNVFCHFIGSIKFFKVLIKSVLTIKEDKEAKEKDSRRWWLYITLIVVMVLWVCTYIQIQQIVHNKYEQAFCTAIISQWSFKTAL